MTLYVPGVDEFNEHEAEAVPLAAKLVGVVGQLTVRPPAGLETELKDTVPAKLKVLVR